MTDQASAIRDAIQQIAHQVKPGGSLFIGEVTATTNVDCTVKIGEMELTGVRLFCQESESGNILFRPIVGSMALIADLSKGELRDLEIIKCDKVDLIQYIQDGITVMIDSVNRIVKVENGLTLLIDGSDGKLSVSNDTASLKDLFTSLADIIQTLTVATPAGPSGTPLPPTLTKITQFNTDFNNLLK